MLLKISVAWSYFLVDYCCWFISSGPHLRQRIIGWTMEKCFSDSLGCFLWRGPLLARAIALDHREGICLWFIANSSVQLCWGICVYRRRKTDRWEIVLTLFWVIFLLQIAISILVRMIKGSCPVMLHLAE